MIDQAIHNKCTGCNMCGDLCPKNAISFWENEEGFLVPKVDYNKCIECKQCVVKCPVLTESSYLKKRPKTYAAWSLDDEIRIKSTSGGIYYEFAKQILSEGGCIVGAVYEDDYKGAKHIIGYNEEDLNRIMGSKYFQSDSRGIYSQTKKILDDGKFVLFCGTPCQCVALQSYIGKEYENLITIDFICRGINSPLAFRKHIEELEEQYGSTATRVHLKNKKTGWQSLATYIEFANGKSCHQDKNHSYWVKGFLGGGGLYIRKSCYECRFRTLPRTADISIGDFWGIKNATEMDMFKGISSLMVNSEKGMELLQKIQNRLHIEEKNFDEMDAGNPAIRNSPEPNSKRDKFFSLLQQNSFSKAVQMCSNNTNNIKIVYVRKGAMILKKIIRRLRFYRNISFGKFIKYNYLSKNIVREKGVYLIPYKNAILDLSRDARIYIKGKNVEIGINKLKGSKAETHVRMNGNAVWYANNGCGLFYNTVLEIKNNSVFESGFFTMNGGSVVICAKHIKFGEDVMLGRNIVIYDSDHHQVWDEQYEMNNPSKDVIIEDHVWLTSNVTVLKGVTIGRDSLVTAQTMVRKDVPEHSLVGGGATGKVVAELSGWSRKSVF